MLIFSANVDDPPACRGPSGKSIHAVEAALERPAEIVDQCLAEENRKGVLLPSRGPHRAGDRLPH